MLHYWEDVWNWRAKDWVETWITFTELELGPLLGGGGWMGGGVPLLPSD